MNPLLKVQEAHKSGFLPDKIYHAITERFPVVISGIDRIEKASGINFPIAYVEPSIVLSHSHSSTDLGILFARTTPVVTAEKLRKECNRCGKGVFMSEHKNRRTCGKCGLTEFIQ